MPLPTAAELTDPNATNTQMKQRLGQLAENVMHKPINISTAINLNTITTPTLATVTNPTNITLALNFPVAGAIGTLEVLQGGSSATVIQKYTLVDSTTYVRGYTSGAWSAWKSESAANKAIGESNKLSILNIDSLTSKAFNQSTNIFDGAELGKTIDVDGTIISDVRWLSGFFPIKAGDVFSVPSSSYRVGYYDTNKVFINRGGADTTITIAAGVTGFMRLSGTIALEDMQLNRGDVLLPYEPHYIDLKNPLFKPVNLTTATNLDTIITPYLATVTNPTNITLALNFPVEGAIGALEVLQGGSSATVIQKYTLTSGVIYVRAFTSGHWSAWNSEISLNKIVGETNRNKIFSLEDFDTKGFVRSTNLFDGAELNKSVSVTGEIIDEAGRWLSGYFPIMSGEVFKIPNSSYRIAYYTENKTFISRTGTTDTVNPPANFARAYFRLSGTNSLATMQMNKGTSLLPYEPHYIDLKNPQAKPPIEPSDTVFFDVSKNLFDKSEVLLGKSVDLSGNIVDDTRWLGGYIPCAANEVFSIPNDSFRIAYYDASKNFILRSGGGGGADGITSFTVPNGATIAYMRFSGLYNLDLMQVNRGATLLPYQVFGEEKLKTAYLPADLSIDVDALKAEIISEISVSNYEPSVPLLALTKVEETWRHPLWLSADGATLYGALGGQLLQSTDDWVTRVNIGAPLPNTILAVRVASDGQLLAATVRDEATNTVAKVYKTVDYDHANPAVATFKEVLAINSTQANITNQWGFSVYDNIVTVSEYGLRGENGAKNVYLSKDNGDTFSLIFNQYTQVVEGGPPLTMTAHMHTAAYDPYYNRIWVVVGDNPNTATYYSDDLGVTWVFVVGSSGTGAIQYTGIQALPDCVIFGSDRSPNGIYVYRRNGKDKMPVIEPLLIINGSNELTHVFGLPFKRDWSPTTPTYFAADKTAGTQFKPVITAMVDGKKGHIMGELGAGDALHGIFGPTASGKIIVVSQTATSAGVVISTANAPTWSKV